MKTASLYIHIPFCDHICGYCDCTRSMYNRHISDQFMVRLLQQIDQMPDGLKTVYVGGGTPTSLADDQLLALLQAVKPKLAEEYEWTFEGNPENLTADKIKLLVEYGVNRMSLGVQITDETLLTDINCHHHFYDVEKGVALLHAHGIDNISLDLMYGLPNQSLASFEQSMHDILALRPNHVSIYSLILEPNSLFGKQGIAPVSEDVETEMYLRCIDLMQAAGYEHYEISNFALPGYRSQHNQVYWHYENYQALGPGASLKVDDSRKTWTRNMVKYLHEDAYDEELLLSQEDAMFEFVMMGLRLREGISFTRFRQRFGVDIRDVYHEAIAIGKQRDLLLTDVTHLKTTFNGFVMLDDVLLPFMK